MAHFAQLDDNNVVIQVIVVANSDLLVDGVETEAKGIAFCQSLFGPETRWKQTSYSGSIRKTFAGIGSTYDAVGDAFIPLKPFQSWILNRETYQWEAPIPYPTDGVVSTWDEVTQSWVATN